MEANSTFDLLLKANDFNLSYLLYFRSTRRTMACLIVAMLVVLWAVPITFIAGLTKLQSLAKQFTFLKPSEYYPL